MVIDEELRALERQFAARPDREARRVFVAALMRAGERRRAVALLAEAARAGEPEALSLLEAWHRPSRLPALGETLVEVASSGHAIQLDDVAGVTATAILVLGYDGTGVRRLLALDARTLVATWSIEAGPRAAAALAAEDVVVVTGKRLRTYSPEDGALRGELTLPGEGLAVAGAFDRAVVVLSSMGRTARGLVAVDLRGHEPALLWQRDGQEANRPIAVGGDRVTAWRLSAYLIDGSPAPALDAERPEVVVNVRGVSVLGGKVAPEVVGVTSADGQLRWRLPLPSWAAARGGRADVLVAGDRALVLVATEACVELFLVAVATGALLRSMPTSLRGRGYWDHSAPIRPRLIAAGGPGSVVGLVPATQDHFFQAARFAPTTEAVAPRRRGPLPGSRTPVIGERDSFELGASAWRTADGRGVVPVARLDYPFLWGKGGWTWRPRDGAAVVSLSRPAVVLEPEPTETELALLVDLGRRAVVALPVAGTVVEVASVPAGLVLAEGTWSRPGEFGGGGFEGCRLSGWEVSSGRRAWAVDLGEAAPERVAPRADGRFDVLVRVESDSGLESVTRVVAPPVCGWEAGSSSLDEGPEVALEWPAPAARGVLALRGGSRGREEIELAAELPEVGPPRAVHGDVVAEWADEEVVLVTRGGQEAARLVLPRDVRPASIRSASTPRPPRGREAPGSVRYVPSPPVLLGVAHDGAHVLAVVIPSDQSSSSWSAVVWALDEADAPLGQVTLGPAFLPPPRAILAAPPGRLRLDLGRSVVLVARHDGPLGAVAWAPSR